MCNCIVSVLLDVCIPMIFNHIRQTDQQVSLPLEHQFIINRYDTTNSQKLIYSWIYQDLFLQLKLQKYIISKRIYHLFFCFVLFHTLARFFPSVNRSLIIVQETKRWDYIQVSTTFSLPRCERRILFMEDILPLFFWKCI